MPIYQFQHPELPIVIEVVQSMKESHVYIDDEGTEWRRVWSAPNTSFDSRIDPFNKKQFHNKDHGKRTIGEMWDESAELSSKRSEKNGGFDPVKEKYEAKYSEKRKGKKHRDS